MTEHEAIDTLDAVPARSGSVGDHRDYFGRWLSFATAETLINFGQDGCDLNPILDSLAGMTTHVGGDMHQNVCTRTAQMQPLQPAGAGSEGRGSIENRELLRLRATPTGRILKQHHPPPFM